MTTLSVTDIESAVSKKLPRLRFSITRYFKEQARIAMEHSVKGIPLQFDPVLVKGLGIEIVMMIFDAETDILREHGLIQIN
ncbi:MAG: hypothetical protein ACMG6E_05295 [Candidatus Roizmanbacteria bacterium]